MTLDFSTFMNTKPGANLLRNIGRIATALETIAEVADALRTQMNEDLARWDAEAKARSVHDKQQDTSQEVATP